MRVRGEVEEKIRHTLSNKLQVVREFADALRETSHWGQIPITLFRKPQPMFLHMKIFSSLLIALLFFSVSSVYAGTIEKCVDNTGKITYTDKGCKSKETAEDTYLPGTKSSNQKYGKTEKTSMVSYKVSEIGVLTDQASTQCASHAIKYFADTHSNVDNKVTAEFLTIKDRSIKGADVQILLEGVVRYKSKNDDKEMKLLCTATRSRDKDWALAFKDADQAPKADKSNAE